LHRRLAGLNLPTMEIGAVISDGQLEMAHRPGIIARDEAGASRQEAVRLRRLPGRTADSPVRHWGQSAAS
jgi:hypothetical protein